MATAIDATGNRSRCCFRYDCERDSALAAAVFVWRTVAVHDVQSDETADQSDEVKLAEHRLKQREGSRGGCARDNVAIAKSGERDKAEVAHLHDPPDDIIRGNRSWRREGAGPHFVGQSVGERPGV